MRLKGINSLKSFGSSRLPSDRLSHGPGRKLAGVWGLPVQRLPGALTVTEKMGTVQSTGTGQDQVLQTKAPRSESFLGCDLNFFN